MINQIKTILFLGILTALFLLVGRLIGGIFGMTIALIIVFLMNFFVYFFSDKMVLLMYRAKQLKESDAPQLFKIVREVSKEAKIPMPKLYVIETETPNAFATGRNPKNAAVAVTSGIMRLLNEEELKGVIAHEISPIKNRDILIATIAATIAGAIAYLANIAKFTVLFGDRDRDSGNIFGLLILAILTPIIALIIQLAISRSREYLADESGARLIRKPKALASALSKLASGVKMHPLRRGNSATASLFIVNPFSAQGLINLFSTHPPINERIKRLNSMKI